MSDRDDGKGGWRTQKGESSADGLLVAWLLRPSGPLSSDCHSWGLQYRFLGRSHSSKLTPPTKHCLPRPTSHDAICPDRWKDRGLKPSYIFFHWFLLSFVSLDSSINHFHPHIHFLSLSSPLSRPTVLSFLLSLFISSTFLLPEYNPHLPFSIVLLRLFCPSSCCSHSFIWIASTSEGIIH